MPEQRTAADVAADIKKLTEGARLAFVPVPITQAIALSAEFAEAAAAELAALAARVEALAPAAPAAADQAAAG